jgi:hypothetical protein
VGGGGGGEETSDSRQQGFDVGWSAQLTLRGAAAEHERDETERECVYKEQNSTGGPGRRPVTGGDARRLLMTSIS